MRLKGIKSEFYEKLSEGEKSVIWDWITLITIFVLCSALSVAGLLPDLAQIIEAVA
jgi:hypothetical protein